MNKNILTNEKGFTLLEIMVSSALLTVILLAVFSVTLMSQSVFNETSIHGRLTQDAMQILRYVGREVSQTSPNVTPSHLNITTDGSGNSVLCFQIPVDWDDDGDAVSGTLDPVVEWGIYDVPGQVSGGRLNGWACYSVTGSQLIRQVTDSTLTPVNGLDRVVANNVQAFTAVRNSDRVQINLNLQATDTVGQSGGTRTLQTGFSTTTYLRNAVN